MIAPATSTTRTYRLIALLIILLSFALRIYHLDARALWFDEAMEYWAASAPLSYILSTVKTALQDPPLYSLLLHFWLYIGRTEFWIRYLSVIFSILTILGVLNLSRVAFGPRTSLLAGLLMAVSIPDVRFAQEAGQYALMSCLLIWNLLFLYLSVKRHDWRWLVPWVISGAVAFYSYYGTIVTIGATALVCLVYLLAQQQRDRLLRLLVAGSFMILLVAPLAVGWMPDQLFRSATASAFQLVLEPFRAEVLRWAMQTKDLLIFMILGYQVNNWPWPQTPDWALWLPLMLLILVGVVRNRHRLLFVWLGAGLLLYYLVGRLGAYPYGWRYALILAPLLWCAVAAGIASLFSRPAWSPRSFLGLATTATLVAIALLAPVEGQEDLRTAARLWATHRQPGEATYVYYGAVPGFRFQINLITSPKTVPALWYLHCWQGKPVDYCSADGIYYGRWIRNLAPGAKGQAILSALDNATPRLWLIFSHVHPGEDEIILSDLAATHRVVARYPADNSSAILLERR